MTDRQADRFHRARQRHFEAAQAHRGAVDELEAAAAELATAGSALAERVRILDPALPGGRGEGAGSDGSGLLAATAVPPRSLTRKKAA